MGADAGEATGGEVERVAVCAAVEEDVEVTTLDYFSHNLCSGEFLLMIESKRYQQPYRNSALEGGSEVFQISFQRIR